MTLADVTILIAARNAAATIGRAIRSAHGQGGCPIVLIDDYSSDATVHVARGEVSDVTVVRPPHHGWLGFTRQCGLDAVRTPFALWLDADDELLPGRAARLIDALVTDDADIAFDEVDLVDGATNRWLRRCPIPSFLDEPPFLLRLFERNHLPGIGQVAFRTAAARRIGYDPDLHGTEDSDFVLRALMGGLTATLVREVGYRMYAYSSSVSRQLDVQRAMYRNALLKHAYEAVRVRLLAMGAAPAGVAWTLASMAMFREEYDAARRFVEDAARSGGGADAAGETDGVPGSWRLAFARGTLDALDGRFDAARAHLETAEALHPTPEGANNLGVVVAHLGEIVTARAHFERGLRAWPEYVDARRNIASARPDRITTHPLRRTAARAEYRDEAVDEPCR